MIANNPPKDKVVYSSGNSVSTITTKVLKTGIKLCQNWELTIDLKIPDQSINHWTNIFGIQKENSVNMQTGSRLPALFIQEYQSSQPSFYQTHSLYLCIASEIGGNPNYPFKFINGNQINVLILSFQIAETLISYHAESCILTYDVLSTIINYYKLI